MAEGGGGTLVSGSLQVLSFFFCSHCCQMSCTNEYIRRIPVSFLSLYYNGCLLEYNSRLPLIQYKNAQISLHLPVYF